MTVDIEAEALRLEPRERARLAVVLLDSLETLSPADVDALWAEEVVARDEELRRHPDRERPAAQVFDAARTLVR